MDKRGACPTLREPMLTGDGLLVRLSPAGTGWSPSDLAASGAGSGPFRQRQFWKSPAAAICRSGG